METCKGCENDTDGYSSDHFSNNIEHEENM